MSIFISDFPSIVVGDISQDKKDVRDGLRMPKSNKPRNGPILFRKRIIVERKRASVRTAAVKMSEPL